MKHFEEYIHKPWLKNKGGLLWYGVKGEFGKIRERIGCDKERELKGDEIEVLLKICDNRIERLRSSVIDIVGVLVAIMAALVYFLLADQQNENYINHILSIPLIIAIILLTASTLSYRAQTYARYAIKEWVLLRKVSSKIDS